MNKIIYLDAAASYQKSDGVISAQMDFLQNKYANAGRGICARATGVDNMLQTTRRCVADFVGTNEKNIVFTSGTTAAMNMIAMMLSLDENSVVCVSDLDHHSARLPFVKTGAKITVCDLDDNMDIDYNNIPVADVLVITAMSNVLGRVQDVARIVQCAQDKNPNVITVVDAAQFVVHEDIDVEKWNCDFMCFSAHKIGADTGLGIMYIKNPDVYKPVFVGGGMVNKVIGDEVFFNAAPDVFEAGTLPLTQIAGLVPAIENLKQNRPDNGLIKYMYDELSSVEQIKIISSRESVMLSFVVDGFHPVDFGALLGARDVCVRVGNMCASWIHQRLNIAGSIRISVGGYNSLQEVKTVISYIKDILK